MYNSGRIGHPEKAPAMTLPVYITFSILESSRLVPGERRALIELCSRAYAIDFAPYWESLRHAVHVLTFARGELVSHACWVERLLHQAGRPPLHAAYVEAVASDPGHQGRGYGTAAMRVLASQLWDYELAALSPTNEQFYARLGWESWRGPLSVRYAHSLVPEPEESAMILRTRRTPAWLDLDAPLAVDYRDAPEQW